MILVWSVTHLQCNKATRKLIFTAPAGIPLSVLSSWQVLSKLHPGPFVADTVTLCLLQHASRRHKVMSWSADRSKWKSCPTNRDKYTFPLYSFTLVFPTLLKPSCCSKASSEEMTDHIKKLAVILTGELVPTFSTEEEVLAFISGVVSCLSSENVNSGRMLK